MAKLLSFRCAWELPSYDEELELGGVGSDLGPDVDGEQSAEAVEDRRQRTHQRGQHGRQHQPLQTCSKFKMVPRIMIIMIVGDWYWMD